MKFKLPAIINANNKLKPTTFNVFFNPTSLNIINAVATHGIYIDINTHATINCHAVNSNGINKAIEISFFKNPKIITEIVSGANPKIFVTGQ